MAAQKSHRFPGQSDHRFFWNRTLYLPYVRAGVSTSDWLMKVMFGSVEIRTIYVGAKQAKAAIISRLSSERAGTRFETRGVNDDGHVANFVETEQLVTLESSSTSFVQIRGSVPLFWEQPGVNVGSHKIRMARGPELSAPAFDSHFRQLKAHYGGQVICNLLGSSLVGSKEGEATLSTAFQTHQKSSQHTDIPHILWDFHAEGGSKHIAKLEAKIGKYVEKMEFFHSAGGATPRTQTGVVRTNCTDCLDRTNHVQMYLGLKMLTRQLEAMQLQDKETIVSRFEDGFKQMWVANGNSLSKIYAGTGALCSGGSKLLDGARSAARTIQNNLLDKDKQEAFDLLIHGTGRNTDFADRARLLLPAKYHSAPVPLLQAVTRRSPDYTRSEPLRVAVGTYNINGGKHFRSVVYKHVSLDDWLLDAHTKKADNLVDLDQELGAEEKIIDMYAIGFEEMVDLDAKNIMNASKENAKEWALELQKTLNRDHAYSLVTFHQLVGVCLYLFVRPELACHIRDVHVEECKMGMGGATGNKGACAISLTYKSSSLCFLASHFAAGQKEVQERNRDYAETLKQLSFPNGRSVLGHDYVFWCGDFNYRINLPRDEVKHAVDKGDFTELKAADQLLIEYAAGNVFQGFTEGELNFPPTYKYDLFSDDFDTSEKARCPAWTDRVLWRRRKPHGPQPADWCPGVATFYGRAELKQSDHRPVLAVLDVQTQVVDTAKREDVVEEILEGLGPSDGTVVSTPQSGPGSVTLSEDVVIGITTAMTALGEVRYSRAVRGKVWTQFREGGAAMRALKKATVMAGGVEWNVGPPCANWNESLTQELRLVANPVLPLARSQPVFRKESRALLSQLSQLSFKELEDLSLAPDSSAPAKPPPPRPGPPARPSAPPPRPAAGPPPRPRPPPSRPPPPDTSSTSNESEPAKPSDPPVNTEPVAKPSMLDAPRKPSDPAPIKAAGFSDLFCAPVDSDLETDIPISLSSGSLVSLAASGEATPAPTRPPLPLAGSLEYPDGYDPLTDSGKCWDTGVDQVIPPVASPPVASPVASPPVASPPSSVGSPTSPTAPPPTAPRRSVSSSASSATSSGASTPTNSSSRPAPPPPATQRPVPAVPGRPPGGPPSAPTGGPPSAPPGGPPPSAPSGAPPGGPLPGAPPGGPPPGPPAGAPPSRPPPGPPPSRPPPGPPPKVPGRPATGPPPAVPKR